MLFSMMRDLALSPLEKMFVKPFTSTMRNSHKLLKLSAYMSESKKHLGLIKVNCIFWTFTQMQLSRKLNKAIKTQPKGSNKK